MDLQDKISGFEHLRIAQEFQSKVGGDSVSSSPESDQLKPDAVKIVYTPDTHHLRRTHRTAVSSCTKGVKAPMLHVHVQWYL